MAYATYTTEAIVCGSKASMTSDKSYLLFTREAGMLWATARSVREERSKQRYALQDFSLVRISLVKGKSGWRIGSVAAVSNPFMGAATRLGRTGVTYVVKLLRRYVQGEQPLPDAFDDVSSALEAMLYIDTQDAAVSLQQVVTVRLLYALGYVVPSPAVRSLLPPQRLGDAVGAYTLALEPVVDHLILQAAEVSHL